MELSLVYLLEILILSSHPYQRLHVSASDANKLWQHLFVNNRYNKNLRPVVNASTQMKIDVQLNLVAIVDFNEVEETIMLTAFIPLRWTDEFLRWDPMVFGNLTHLSISQETIWKPYINLENSVVKLGELGTPSLQLLVEHTGNVLWKPVELFIASCPVDLYRFPFDIQVCYLKFETSGYKQREVVLSSSMHVIDLHEYGGTSGWTIESSKIETIIKGSDSYAICSLSLKRKPLFVLMNIFLPILLLSVLNLLVFILPVESGEKASFVVTMFLSLAVFLTIVSGQLPENSEKFSLLSMYVFESTLLSTLVAVVTIGLIRIHHRDRRSSVPAYLQNFVKLFSGSARARIVPRDINCYPREDVNENNTENADMSNQQETEMGVDVTWPDVVNAFDKIFFVMFLISYTIITVSLFGIALRS